jgi:rRNA-processing protein FCF1
LKMIIDTNFLFIPSEFKIDIFEALFALFNERIEPVLLSTNYDELERMSHGAPPKLRKQALFALKLAQRCHIVRVEKNQDETNDDVVVRVAESWKTPVATNDGELRRRLRARNIPVIFLRGKKRLELQGAR